MTKISSIGKSEKKIGIGYLFLILLLLNLLIFFMPGKKKVSKVDALQQKASPEAPIQEAPAAPEPASIGVSPIIWTNPDEVDNMSIKFKLINNNIYSVSNIEIEFKYYDVLGELIEGSQTKVFADVIAAGEEKEYHNFVLGDYPEDTIKVIGETLSASRALSE